MRSVRSEIAVDKTVHAYIDPLYSLARAIQPLVERIPVINKIITVLFSIKSKLISITTIIVLLVIMALSVTLLSVQYNALIEKTDETCRATAVGLSSIAIEGITQNKRSIISDYVNNLRASRISGLSSAFVAEYKYARIGDEKRIANAEFIAHSDPKRVDTLLPKAMLNELMLVKEFHREAIMDSGERYYLYTFPVEWRVKLKGEVRTAALGVIQLRFLEKDVLAVFYRSRSAVLLTSLIVIIIAAFLMYLIGMLIVRPILILADGVNAVKGGDLSMHLDIQSPDEIGRLSTSFNEMTAHLREKLAMQKFVSASTVKMIQDSAGRTHASVERKGERKSVAVFFSDIRGFTAFSEKRQPEEVVEMLNFYLDLQTKILLKHGGDVDKYVGDEVMAVFTGKTMGINSLKAAVEIQRAMDADLKKRKAARDAQIAIGIGINIGDVIMGSMGASNRMDFTVIGDAVNLGARLCSAAGKGEIIVTKSVYDCAPSKARNYKFYKAEPIMVKGKTDPIVIYKVK